MEEPFNLSVLILLTQLSLGEFWELIDRAFIIWRIHGVVSREKSVSSQPL